MRLMVATFILALAASVAQTAGAQAMDGPGGPGGPGHFGRAGGPHRIERMLDVVGATADQRAQIKKIVQSAQVDLRSQHEAGRKLREQSMGLFTQPAVDPRAAEGLRQQMLALHDQASKRRLQMMLDVSAVLTPEQRKTLGDRIAKRRAMMQRHRAERAALDGK
jgi:Spy/CpxP family protein refolding chaperone